MLFSSAQLSLISGYAPVHVVAMYSPVFSVLFKKVFVFFKNKYLKSDLRPWSCDCDLFNTGGRSALISLCILSHIRTGFSSLSSQPWREWSLAPNALGGSFAYLIMRDFFGSSVLLQKLINFACRTNLLHLVSSCTTNLLSFLGAYSVLKVRQSVNAEEMRLSLSMDEDAFCTTKKFKRIFQKNKGKIVRLFTKKKLLTKHNTCFCQLIPAVLQFKKAHLSFSIPSQCYQRGCVIFRLRDAERFVQKAWLKTTRSLER